MSRSAPAWWIGEYANHPALGGTLDRGVLQRILVNPEAHEAFCAESDDAAWRLEVCLELRHAWKVAPKATAAQAKGGVHKVRTGLRKVTEIYAQCETQVAAHHRMPLTLENLLPELEFSESPEQDQLAKMGIPELLERIGERIALRTPFEDTDAMPDRPGREMAFTTFIINRLLAIWDEDQLADSRLAISAIAGAVINDNDYEIDSAYWWRLMEDRGASW